MKSSRAYEGNQNFNFITRWLHGYRFRNAIDVIGKLAATQTGPLKIVEIGCAQGKLYSVLDPLFSIEYIGIDVNSDYLADAKERYGGRPNFNVIQGGGLACLDEIASADVVIALETLEHIPQTESFRIVEKIAALQPGIFICSVPIEIGPSVLIKNVGSFLMGYVRHRSYSWRETWWAGTYQLHKLPPHATAHKGFDWRWLAHVVRYHFRLREVRRFPFGFFPAALSTSVFMIAEARSYHRKSAPRRSGE